MKHIAYDDPSAHDETQSVLTQGGVVVVPTDTVYGLIGRATDETAIEKIYRIKMREKEKPLGIFVKDMAMAERYVEITAKYLDGLEKCWPGALTGVFRSRGLLPQLLHRNTPHLGVRIPKNIFLLKLLGEPLAQTSANISGRGSYTKIADVLSDFMHEQDVDLIVDAGDIPDTMASTGVDFTQTPPRIFRKGSITKEELENAFGKIFI